MTLINGTHHRPNRKDLSDLPRDIILTIKENMDNFSKRQKLIADYILENFDKAAYMTASRLGEEIGVSESTVVRFSYELGFDGYPKFQKSLREHTIKKSTAIQRMEIASRRIGEKSILESVLKSDIANITRTLEEIDAEQFDGAIDALLSAKKIYIMGVRSASALSSFAGAYLNILFENTHIIRSNAAADIFEQLLHVKEGDVVLGMSFPRYSKNTKNAMEYAKKRGATVIGITDNVNSPVVECSDFCLIARSDAESFADSLVAPMSVINALIVGLGMKKQNEVRAVFEKLEDIWDENEVYNK